MFKDNKLRLLMNLVGFERLGMNDEPDATWIIPSSLTSEELGKSAEVVGQHERNPKLDYGDDDNPIAPQDLLRRKALHRPRAAYDDDSENDDIANNGEEDFLFPAGGPTVRKSDALEDLKKRRRRRHRDDDAESSINEDSRDLRRKAREEANLEKRKKIKSDLFVHDSDEEEDEERDRQFFAQEEERRRGQSMKVAEALRSGNMEGDEDGGANTRKGRKRKMVDEQPAKGKRRKSSPLVMDDDDLPIISAGSSSPTHTATLEDSEADAADTPLSSPHTQSLEANESQWEVGGDNIAEKSSITKGVNDIAIEDAVGDESEGSAKVPKPTYSRARAGFIVDSDSEDAAPVTKQPRSRARAGLIIDSDTE